MQTTELNYKCISTRLKGNIQSNLHTQVDQKKNQTISIREGSDLSGTQPNLNNFYKRRVELKVQTAKLNYKGNSTRLKGNIQSNVHTQVGQNKKSNNFHQRRVDFKWNTNKFIQNKTTTRLKGSFQSLLPTQIDENMKSQS